MKIGIIGGGASGIMAAIIAADSGAEVTILEKKDRIGKKILATGNGKCNFTNKIVEKDDYISQKEGIYQNYISQFDEKRVLHFFAEQGMLAKEKSGYFYPRSEQASTVLDVLRKKLQEKGVTVLTESCPDSLKRQGEGFVVRLGKKTLFFHHLILACGSFAGEKLQEGISGYDYAQKFGHTLVPVVPALVQLRADHDREVFKAIAGVRCEAKITLYIEGKMRARERGELQLTDYGISGIPVFQLSRHAAYGFHTQKKVKASIDFLPEYDDGEWEGLIREKWEGFNPQALTEDFFLGFLNKKLNLHFIRKAGLKPQQPMGNYSYEQILQACLQMKNWEVELTGTNPFASAQVCAGGVSMDEVTLQLESRKVKGLFFAGEILDVDGRCGGYNLQWAWTSGYIAGKAAAERRLPSV
ncbi:MAG: aminoacetone oxidase family FAD-binding enzyme [Lachnospiraceae bacterium]|nr:aminoacetone oxidase family FAD-binding enzyme [Lachnospiraceae bacterium]